MDNDRAERNQLLAEHMIKNLKSRNMAGYYAKTEEEALKMALDMMPGRKQCRLGRFSLCDGDRAEAGGL